MSFAERPLDACRNQHRLGRFLIWSTLAVFCCANAPLPMLMTGTSGVKDTSIPFPCQSSACGCRSAQQCWTSCCCHTLTERLAWARRNGVAPPERYVATARATAKAASATKKKPSCCSVEQRHDSRKGTCCDTKPTVSASGEDQESAPAPFVLALMAVKCHGGYHACTSIPWTILPLAIVAPELPIPHGDHLVQGSDAVQDLAYQPPVPPPRDVVSFS